MNVKHEAQAVAGRSISVREVCINMVRSIAVKSVAAISVAIVAGAPMAAHADLPPRFIVDGQDGGIYAQIEGLSAADVVPPDISVVAFDPNFGAQDEYEAYIASLSASPAPGSRPRVAWSPAPVMIDKDERIFLYANPAAENAAAVAGPSIGSQSSYERYVDSIGFNDGALAEASDVMPTFSEGYDWYVDPVALAAASIPPEGVSVASGGDVSLSSIAPSSATVDNTFSAGRVAVSTDSHASTIMPTFSEGYDWYVDPVALRAASIPPAEVSNPGAAAYERLYSEGYDWYVDPAVLRSAVIPSGNVSGSALDAYVAAKNDVESAASPKVRMIDGKYAIPRPHGGYQMYE